jgi:hypothetical protein
VRTAHSIRSAAAALAIKSRETGVPVAELRALAEKRTPAKRTAAKPATSNARPPRSTPTTTTPAPLTATAADPDTARLQRLYGRGVR